MKRWLALGALLGVASAAAAACGSPRCGDTKTCDDGTNPGGGDGGAEATVEGSVGEGGPSAECTESPSAKPKVLDDKCGVFVSLTGVDTNGGTKASPLRSVAQGATLAKSTGKAWVFVCQGTYSENSIVVNGDLGLYGKLDCTDGTWTVGAARAVIEASEAGKPVLTFNKSKGRLEGVEIRAKDAADPGQSSIGVFANEGELSVVGSVIEAGTGKDGDAGASGGPPAAQAAAGNAASTLAGGPVKVCKCPDGDTAGGPGGTLGFMSGNGFAGEPDAGAAPPADGAGGLGGAGSCNANGNGHDGADGDGGTAGANAATSGVIDPGLWQPQRGADGTAGARGQGGGGGGAKTGHGGGGGCGGCGGAFGRGGQGGGASVAVMALASAIKCNGSELVVAGAGKGGGGGAPQLGQSGGASGTAASGGCLAGLAGSGGNGGNGGGGAGGISAGIAFKGPDPVVDPATKFTLPGTPAAGGTGGSGPVKTGVVADTLKLD